MMTHDTVLEISAPGILENDSGDPDGDRVTLVVDQNVSHGSLNVNQDGSFTYTPDPGFVGSGFFTYHLDDGLLNGRSNTATVWIGTPRPGRATMVPW